MEQPKRRKSDRKVGVDFCRRFGAIAVYHGFVDLDQVKQAMFEQLEDNVHGREHRLLGTILFEHGWITDGQIETVLKDLKNTL